MLHTLPFRDLRNTPAKLWRSLRRDHAVALSVNGVPKALVIDVPDGDLEAMVTLVRQIRAREALTRLRLQAAASGADRLTDEEIDAEIAAVRRGRRKRSA